MDEDDKKIEKLSSSIADGSNINWNELKEQNPNEHKLIDKLNVINDISKFFGNDNKQKPDESKSHNELFTWGHLQVAELIGEGSYGEVYRAYDSVLDRDVALKLIKQENISPYQSRVFIQEAKNLAKVRQRNVLAVHGANVYNSRSGIWTDFIQGENLSNLHESNYCYSSKEIVNILNALIDALIAVHEAGLIHGDIKPSNVMQDENEKIILMDFGTGVETDKINQQGDFITGSPLLMAPELILGKSITQACDIYSLGELIFKLATAHYRINGKNLEEIHNSHNNNSYRTFNDFDVLIPKELKQLINRMLLTDSCMRPTALELRKQLNYIISAPKRRVKRNTRLFIATALSIGLILSLLGFYNANIEKEKAIQERNKAESVTEFLQELIASPSSQGKGRQVKVADLLDVASIKMEHDLNQSDYVKAEMYNTIGNSYLALQLPEDALTGLNKSLKINQQLYGANSIQSQKTMTSMMNAYTQLGQPDRSISISEKIISLDKQLSNNPSYYAQMAQINLAEFLSRDKKYTKAHEILNGILTDIDNSGVTNLLKFYVLKSMMNVYQDESRYGESEKIAKQTLLWLKKYHENSLTSQHYIKNGLALSLVKQGKMKQADDVFNDIYHSAQQLFGKNNIGYLTVLLNYGAFLQETNNLDRSFEILQEALALSNKIQGARHEVTINIKINLANTLVSKGQIQEGEKLMQSALSDGRKVLGESDVGILILEYNLAELLNNTQRYTQAEELARVNHAKMLDKFGDQHLYTLLSQDNIANSLSGQNQWQQAETIYNRIFTQIESTQSLKSPYTQLILTHRIENFIQSKNTSKAKQFLNQLYQAQVDTLGGKHPDTLKTKNQIDSLTKIP